MEVMDVIGGMILVLLLGMLIGAAWMAPAPPPTTTFQIGQCYQHTGHRERWEPPVDGMVFDVGRHKYRIVPSVYLSKSIVKPEHMESVDINTFNNGHVVVACPER